MANRWRNPYNSYVPWSQCSTCGQDWPSQKITFNPRFGWQCPPCWDGMIQRDQIETPNFPYEGTRKTPSPLTNTLLEGIAPGSLYQTYTYYLIDRITGDIYSVVVPPITIAAGGVLVYNTLTIITLTLVASTTELTFRGIRINNGWAIYVRNGAIAVEYPLPSALGIINGICDFGAIGSECTVFVRDQDTGVIYVVDFSVVPPVPALAAEDASPVFDAVQVNDGWYLIIQGSGVLTSTLDLPAGSVFGNSCVLDHVRIDENGDNEGTGGNGGGGVTPPGPPLPPEPPTCPIFASEDWESLYCQEVEGASFVVTVSEAWEVAFCTPFTITVTEQWED